MICIGKKYKNGSYTNYLDSPDIIQPNKALNLINIQKFAPFAATKWIPLPHHSHLSQILVTLRIIVKMIRILFR
jgi:hypothetical protein